MLGPAAEVLKRGALLEVAGESGRFLDDGLALMPRRCRCEVGLGDAVLQRVEVELAGGVVEDDGIDCLLVDTRCRGVAEREVKNGMITESLIRQSRTVLVHLQVGVYIEQVDACERDEDAVDGGRSLRVGRKVGGK
eukprot:8490551-Pyramimonas_sp.AAC.1